MEKGRTNHRPREDDGMDKRGGHRARTGWVAATMALLVVLLAYTGWATHEERLRTFFDAICCGQVIAFPVPGAQLGQPVAVTNNDEVCRDTGGLLSLRPRNGSYPFLAGWTETRQQRLEMWLDLGIRLAGDWQSEELAVTLDVLDAFGEIYGEERFAEIVQQAVRSRSGGWRNYLTVKRLCGKTLPAAAWSPRTGQIALTGALFDDTYLQNFYNWQLINDRYTAPNDTVGLLEIVIAHEFGHVLIDGLRLEAVEDGEKTLSMEELYVRYIPAEERPHGTAPTNENMATEVGAWALGIQRPPEVMRFRSRVLTYTTGGEKWPQQVAVSTPLSATSR